VGHDALDQHPASVHQRRKYFPLPRVRQPLQQIFRLAHSLFSRGFSPVPPQGLATILRANSRALFHEFHKITDESDTMRLQFPSLLARKTLLLCFLLSGLLASASAQSPSLAGEWRGTYNINIGGDREIIFTLTEVDGVLTGVFDNPTAGIMAVSPWRRW
jgi:mRNA-degrading endonuclease YafQ of YafQ-DinJ toxin-antitoxin module